MPNPTLRISQERFMPFVPSLLRLSGEFGGAEAMGRSVGRAYHRDRRT